MYLLFLFLILKQKNSDEVIYQNSKLKGILYIIRNYYVALCSISVLHLKKMPPKAFITKTNRQKFTLQKLRFPTDLTGSSTNLCKGPHL
jgi:hypothetical protein